MTTSRELEPGTLEWWNRPAYEFHGPIDAILRLLETECITRSQARFLLHWRLEQHQDWIGKPFPPPPPPVPFRSLWWSDDGAEVAPPRETPTMALWSAIAKFVELCGGEIDTRGREGEFSSAYLRIEKAVAALLGESASDERRSDEEAEDAEGA